MNIDSLLKNALVYDIETSAFYSDGREVNIRTNFDDYIALAQCKWIGIYSYQNKKEYYLEVSKDRQKIIELFNDHHILIGFNSESFDFPILLNNHLVDQNKKFNHVDCMTILGSSTFKDKNGYPYKDRGNLMGYKFKKNSLECIANTMELEFQKSEIDYKIFQKDTYTEEEKKDIIYYLKNDVMATKGMFDKLWTYWIPFTDMLDWKFISNFSWIKSSIASLIYKSACYSIGAEPTYSDQTSKKEEMGGRVLLPKYEEVENVWYIDFSSLYPHIFCMFNLFAEVSEDRTNAWHGNEMFKVKGYYDISYHHKLSEVVKAKLKQRLELKAKDPDNPLVYTLKIWLNGLYGCTRSSIFEKVHTPNCGWDTCWIGQQIQKFTQDEMKKYGFESVAGDTDSLMVRGTKKSHNDRDYIKACLKKIVEKILDNVPFPVDTFNIDIENFLPYMLFPFSEQPVIDEETRKLLSKDIIPGYRIEEIDKKKVIIEEATGKIVKKGRSWVKERKGRKKNYAYIYKDKDELKIELVGLPIKKDGRTQLGFKIYSEILEPKILEKRTAKFSKQFIEETLEEYLKKKDILHLLSREFKIKPFDTYKIPKGKTEPSGIHAQISKGYFNGGDGVINLIKNKKIGNAGKGDKYCTVNEAIEAKLNLKDLDLEKVHNELEPFILHEEKLTLTQ